MKLTTNTDPDKYGYSACDIGLDARSQFSLTHDKWSKTNTSLFLVWTIVHQGILIIEKIYPNPWGRSNRWIV